MTIDYWTLGIQTVNVLILILLLRHFFWRPVAAVIAERKTAAINILEQAETKYAEAVSALAEVEKTRAGFQKERDAIHAAAHESAELMSIARLEKAKNEAEALAAAAQEERERNRDAAERLQEQRAIDLAVDIAAQLAARLDGPVVRTVFLDWLIAEIESMPESARRAATAEGNLIEVVSAASLSLADQDMIRERLTPALGGKPAITFETDPDLISGLELRGPHFSVRNSWQADLDRIREDMSSDD